MEGSEPRARAGVIAIVVAGGIATAAWVYLAVVSVGAGASLAQFLVVAATVLTIQASVVAVFRRNAWRIPLLTVILFAALFRLLGVLGAPILEDDHFRFLWDGRNTVEQGSPYGVPPSAAFGEDLGDFEDILDGINHPDVATIYGPTSQWTFALAYHVAPGKVWPLQALSAVLDLVLILLLARVATPLAVFLYAWSPLVIKEFAFTAHPDIVGVSLLFAAFLLFRSRRFVATGALSALALGVKPFALVLVPFLLGLSVRAWFACVAVAFAVAIPFGLVAAWVPEGLKAMGGDWLFNAPLYFAALAVGGPVAVQVLKGLLLLAFALWWASRYLPFATAWIRGGPETLPSVPAAPVTGLFLLILPALNPWYLVWWLPFAALGPLRLTPWVASAAVLLSYISGINLDNAALELYEQPVWVLIVEAAAIAMAIALDVRGLRRPADSA